MCKQAGESGVLTQMQQMTHKALKSLAAGKLIKSVTGARSHAYSRTHMILYVDEKEFELRKRIPSGKKWIVQQLVGQAGYTTINTSKHQEHMVPC